MNCFTSRRKTLLRFFTFGLALLINFPALLFSQQKILHYTQTTGWNHGTADVSLNMFRDLGNANGFSVDHDNDGHSFNNLATLLQYDVIVWSNTSGSHNLNDIQKANFEAYINQGGNYLGIHAASDTYRHSSSNGGGTGAWDFYAEHVCGGSVQQNPNHTAQNFNATMDHIGSHASLENVPSPWNKPEEYYYWEGGYLNSNITEVLRVRNTGGQSYDRPRPISWYKTMPGGGRSFYTAMGHDHSNFTSDQNFRNHVRDALLWVMSGEGGNGGGGNGGGGTSTTADVSGELKKWHKVTLTFEGPQVNENDGNNPFLNYRLDVTFTNGGKSYTVPGYFAADGNAAESSASSGNKWRVHFTPDATGTWTYTASFRQGNEVAVSNNPNAGSSTDFDGATGTFNIGNTDKSGVDHRGKGLLRYIGQHHLQFAETGEYYIKGGADSPENFLGYLEFDGTQDGGGLGTPGLTNGLHTYGPHIGDWNNGDPTWKGTKGKGIIGAINYLSSVGGNSIYFLTYNTDGGDGRDSYMWTSPNDRTRYDVSKLAQWEIVFSHMDAKGIQLHVVTQEVENNNAMGGLSTERKLYYRELVARFAHHLALQWNLGEENSNNNNDKKSFASHIRSLDPYDHPITVHTFYDEGSSYYNDLFGHSAFEATSLQGTVNRYNDWTVELRNRSASAGRKWAIYGDEQAPAVSPNNGNLNELRKGLWGNLMGGGAGVEWYFGYQNTFGDVQSEDWRVIEPLWRQTKYALDFFQTLLPFHEMNPDNNLGSNGAKVLAKRGDIYALYLENGGSSNINLEGNTGSFDVSWFNPRNGGNLQTGSVTTVTGPGTVSIGTPPAGGGDWVAIVGGNNNGGNGGGGNCDADFEEQDGLVVIEAESGSLPGGWTAKSTIAGYTGTSYVEWTGGDAFNNPGNGLTEYSIQINNPGTYAFKWRSRIAMGNNNTEHNDAWLRFPDADEFFAVQNGNIIYPHGSGQSPTPEGSGADNWFKIYMNQLDTWSWITQTSDNDPHFIFVQFNNPGIYKLQISGRSNGFALDRMVLFSNDVLEAVATNTGQGETTCDGGNTGGNTPPSFTLSGDVTVTENFSTTEYVTITPGNVPADEQDQVVTYSISPANVDFANVSINAQTGRVSITSVPNKFGSQVFRVTANDGQPTNNTYSQTFTLTVLSEASANAVIRINAGGSAYTAAGGLLFEADVHYSGGRPYDIENAISGTDDDVLYQSERTNAGTLSYNIPVQTGDYVVRLHFAEIYHNQNGARVFSVDLEGQTVLQNYDIVATAGPFAADVQEFAVSVADGILNIDMNALVDQPKISAIEVLKDETTVPNTPPTFSISGDVIVDEDFTTMEYVTVAPDEVPVDEQDQTVTYSLTPASVDFANVEIDPATGEVMISAIADGFGTQEFVITADDGMPNDNTASQAFTLTVNPFNDAPVFVVSGDLELNEDFGGTQSVDVTPGPVPTNETGQTVTYTLSPASIDFANVELNTLTGEVSVTAVENAHGTQEFTITANDGEASNNTYSAVFSLIINPVNDAPTFNLSTNLLNLLENFTTTETVTVTPEPVPTDEEGQTVVYSLSPASVDFANIDFNPSTGNITITSVPNAVGIQIFTITSDDGQGSNNTAQKLFTLTVSNEPEVGYSAHINSGGPAYTTVDGQDFVPDTYFDGGEQGTTTEAIADTEDDPLYQTVRAGESFSYNIPLYFGNYTIRLHLADIDTAENNVFNVQMEGINVLNNLDLASTVGKNTASVREFNLTISDGELNIVANAVAGIAQIAAVEVILTSAPENSPPFFSVSGDIIVYEDFETTEIVSVTPHPVPPAEMNQTVTYSLMPEVVTFANVEFDSTTGEVRFTAIPGGNGTQIFTITADDGQDMNNIVSEIFMLDVLATQEPNDSIPRADGLVRINAGGPSYLSLAGDAFDEDRYFNGGQVLTNEMEASGTDDPTLYNTARVSADNFSYRIPLYFGNYTVRLHFVDHESAAVGERVFNGEIEGYPLIHNLDIFAEAGSSAALVKEFNLTVTDGSLDIDFMSVIGQATVSAIEVVLVSAPENRPPFFTLSGDITVEENFIETQYVSATPLPVHPEEETQHVVYSISPASVDFAIINFDPISGFVMINSLPNGIGSQVFTITADDGQSMNNIVSESFKLTVTPNSGGGGQQLTTLRINSGSDQDLIFGGHTFVKDIHYTNNYAWTNESSPAISNTPYDGLFHTERAAGTDLGSFGYDIPVVNGTYKVFLHFAEIYWGADGGSTTGGAGTRVFNVDIEGVPSLVNFDIIGQVGSMAAISEEFEVTITDGMINLELYASANRPKISAIEILPADQGHLSISNTGLTENNNSFFNPDFDPTTEAVEDRLTVVPNPAGAKARLHFESELSGTFEVMIYDSWGRLYSRSVVQKRDRFEEYPLSVEYLPAGLYAVQVVQNGYSIATKLWRTGQ